MPLPGRGAKIDAAALKARIAGIRQDVHQVQPAAVSITNATEYGLAWRAGEIGEIGEIAKRSDEHTSELQSLMRISYAVFCLKKKTQHKTCESTRHRRQHTRKSKTGYTIN